MSRRERRKAKKQNKKKDLQEKMGLFDKLPSDCLVCHAPFDRTDPKMVSTWTVVVREDDKKVPIRLYCPACWQAATQIYKSIEK